MSELGADPVRLVVAVVVLVIAAIIALRVMTLLIGGAIVGIIALGHSSKALAFLATVIGVVVVAIAGIGAWSLFHAIAGWVLS